MVALLLAWLAAAAAAPDGPPPTMLCMLVTPRGDAIDFLDIQWDETGDRIGLVATAGSAWPLRTIPGSRTALDRDPAGKRRFALGGTGGIVLELGQPERGGQRQTITLLRREGRRSGVPLAFGFCRHGSLPSTFPAMDPVADPDAIGAAGAAFDPARWPEQDCGLLLDDGRRSRLGFRLTPGNRVELVSPLLWAGRPMDAEIRWLDSGRHEQVGAFHRNGGPTGTQTMIANAGGTQAAKLIRLEDLGDTANGGLTGYAICGYSQIVRRAVQE